MQTATRRSAITVPAYLVVTHECAIIATRNADGSFNLLADNTRCQWSIREEILVNLRRAANCNSPRRQELATRLAAAGDLEMREALAVRGY
jgi:hypothetical protein